MSVNLNNTAEDEHGATPSGAAEAVGAAETTQDGRADGQASEQAEAAQNAQRQVLGSLNGPLRAEMEADGAEIAAQLRRIGHAIEAHRAEIVASWRGKASADTLLASSASWSRRQFEDHVPRVVSLLCDKMAAWPAIAPLHAREMEAAQAHSEHRWQQGYDMRSLTREWGHLNAALLEALDFYWPAPSGFALQQALRVSRSLVAEIILESTSENVTEYARLLQSEAAARAREMEAAIAMLRENERARGQVLREAAHDLRGGLGIVSGSASLIDHEQLPEGDRAEVGRILRRGVRSLHEMMTDLIDLARLEAGEERAARSPYDVGELMRELCNTAAPLAHDKGLALLWDGPDEMPAEGDPVKVRRVAQNLLLNAIKYTSQGSVALSWAPDGDDRWLLCVRDTGPGLDRSPAAPLARAMESATSTARKVEGRTEAEQNPSASAHPTPAPQLPGGAGVSAATSATAAQAAATGVASGTSSAAPSDVPGEGVGLAIVKRLCDLLGASIELDTRHSTPKNRSSQSSGSTFRVLFPRFVAPPGEQKPAPLETGASLSVETVLSA